MSESTQEVEVLWLAENGYHPGSALKEHAHQEYFQVYYILEGGGQFIVEHESVPFDSGMFFFFRPRVVHGISAVDKRSCEMVRILEAKFTVFDGELMRELEKIPAVCQGTRALQSLLYQAFLESVQKEIYYEKTVSHLFVAWLYQVIRLNKNFSQNLASKELHPKATTYIKQYLNEHYAEEVSLDMLAEVMGYSKNYLCRIFKENTGETINECLNEIRANKAAQLLTSTDWELAEIGRRCGYNSIHYFIKTFKKLIGVPPGSYRKSELTGSYLVVGEVESINSAMRTTDVELTTVTSDGGENDKDLI